MRVASFFAGIGGFDLGFERQGHEVVFQCEIDPFCNKVLDRQWPQAARSGDIREIQHASAIPRAEVWTGGFPCQDVSLARGSKREGLRGKNTGLFFEFARLVGEALPPIVILENVPGLLSSHGGRDFAVILQTLGALGYAVGWRVLNSKYFGIPQSRSRLYIVGYHRNPVGAGSILFESECSDRGFATSGSARANAVSPFKESVGNPLTGPIVQRLAYCLAATSGRHTGTDWSRTYVSYPNAVRRLTPEEAERLQGFPTGWTEPVWLPEDQREKLDSARYAALGNAVSVPVAEWLGARLAASVQATSNLVQIEEELSSPQLEPALALSRG